MNNISINQKNQQAYHLAALFTLALRLVVGWTYFSAFWRRLFLANKLDPESAGYIGEKFNHFLPNALGIKPMIEYLVSNPDTLWWAMTAFTIIEGIVGLFILVGLFSRLMSIGVFALAMGILLGSGWLGTTCLDEWQIGVLGIAAGFSIFLSAGGKISMDEYLLKRKCSFSNRKWFSWISSGPLQIKDQLLHRIVLIGAFCILFMTLYTNQYFHGGLWGPLHNKSVKPVVEVNEGKIEGSQLSFEVYRVEGVDVYGSFLIEIKLTDQQGNPILQMDGSELAKFPKENIRNDYVAKVKPGKHSLILPLGAKASIFIKRAVLAKLPSGEYMLELVDISGISWTEKIRIQ